jgi:hypothetical protein
MKNIHVLPTEHTSRLHKIGNEWALTHNANSNPFAKQQNIYITSDEEIKKGDWVYVKTPNIYGGNVIAKSIGNSNGCWADHILTETTDEKGYHPSHCVKIILTTDQDLIKDGVQAIDDEFLEWFVKNPSRERVEWSSEKIEGSFDGEDWKFKYGTVIPRTTQQIIDEDFAGGLDIGQIIPKEEPKQETLEEAAEVYSKRSSASVFQENHKKDFINGAKWQQQRMYSEEDMIRFANIYSNLDIDELHLKYFNNLPRFKKK